MRTVGWALPLLMQRRRIESATALQKLLGEAGVSVSRQTAFRLVARPPKRLLVLVGALCEVLACTPSELLPLEPGASVFRDIPAPPAFMLKRSHGYDAP